MDEFQLSNLSINGFQGRPIPNRFFRLAQGRQALAVVFPGLTYTADMPLLFYTGALLRQRGCDLLQVNADYTIAEYQTLPPQERSAWLIADTQGALTAARQQSAYEKIVLVGKSIGTLALAYLVSQAGFDLAVTIWLTPLVRQTRLVEAASRHKGPALFIASTADPLYDAAAMQTIQSASAPSLYLLEGANHSLEIPGDTFRSLDILKGVMQEIAKFLDRSGFGPSA